MVLLHTGHLKRPMLSRSYTAAASGVFKHGKVFAKYTKRGGLALIGGLAFAGLAAAWEGAVSADELLLVPTKWPWPQTGLFKSHDHAALRRGFQVYREVCAACHTMEFLNWRHHINVTHTEAEIKAMSAESFYEELDDEGNVTLRPGKPIDFMPNPYPNKIKARMANNGAEPPDLSLICIAREDGINYLFNLLMGYEPVPPGQKIPDEGQSYNPTMHGSYIAMPQQIYNETVDYEDGTVPYASQIARDVTQYYSWTYDPFINERKLWGAKALVTWATLTVLIYLIKRKRFAVMDSQKFISSMRKKSPEV